MKGRIFVVDKEFIDRLDDNMCIEIQIPSPNDKQWFKTITDILADAFQLQLGDYVFFWQKKENNKNTYIKGLYKIGSNVFYEDNLFKIKIKEVYHFDTPITEYDILNDPYNKFNLWNIIGKKIAGKSRASSPLTDYEIEFLTQKLIDKNPNYKFNFDYKDKLEKISNEVIIDLTQNKNNVAPASLKKFKPNTISYLNEDNSVKYEKFFELLLNWKFREKDASFYKALNININNVVWYANYLPYTIGRKEIDYLILEAQDKKIINQFDLIEFKKGTIDKDHIERCLIYAEWLNNNLGKGAKLTQPIILCEKQNRNTLKNINEALENTKLENPDKPLKVYTIQYIDNQWKIEKVR